VRILVDPWLVGDLTFADQDWLYKGKKRTLRSVNVDIDQICADTDVILITQVGCRGSWQPDAAAGACAAML
jgi:hypothetical protein